MDSANLFSITHGECLFILQYPYLVLHYPWIVNYSTDSANEDFTYPWKVNSSIHVPIDKISLIHLIEQDPKPKWEKHDYFVSHNRYLFPQNYSNEFPAHVLSGPGFLQWHQ